MKNRFWTFQMEKDTCKANISAMQEAFPFLTDNKKHIVSIVGAGGKTTLLYALAEYMASQHKKVLVTTSTHIMRPEQEVYATTPVKVRELWTRYQYAVIGLETTDHKLQQVPIVAGLLNEQLRHDGADEQKAWIAMLNEADIVLIEADGSKRLPCKAPAAHEPVIWSQSDIVIDVAGLSAIGNKIQESCCRVEQVMDILQEVAQHILIPNDIARLVSSLAGGRKGVDNRQFYILLNQCDTEQELEHAKQVVSSLSQECVKNCIAACFL